MTIECRVSVNGKPDQRKYNIVLFCGGELTAEKMPEILAILIKNPYPIWMRGISRDTLCLSFLPAIYEDGEP